MKPSPKGPGFWTPEKLRVKGIARGEEITEKQHGKTRIRWSCRRGICKERPTTWPKHDPRIYTYLPHRGTDKFALTRQILLTRRNSIEGLWSMLKLDAVAGKGQIRAKWAGDIEMEWLLAMRMIYEAARRVVHADGSYRRLYDEAMNRGLLTPGAEIKQAPVEARGETTQVPKYWPPQPVAYGQIAPCKQSDEDDVEKNADQKVQDDQTELDDKAA